MSWMDTYRRSLEDGTYYSDGYRYMNNAISEILKQNYSKWMDEDELRSALHDIHELLKRESLVMSHDDISQLEFAREDIANRLESLSKDGTRKSNPTDSEYATDSETGEWLKIIPKEDKRPLYVGKDGNIHVGSIANVLTANDLGRSFEVTKTKEDTDGDGDTDKMTIEKKEE